MEYKKWNICDSDICYISQISESQSQSQCCQKCLDTLKKNAFKIKTNIIITIYTLYLLIPSALFKQ